MGEFDDLTTEDLVKYNLALKYLIDMNNVKRSAYACGAIAGTLIAACAGSTYLIAAGLTGTVAGGIGFKKANTKMKECRKLFKLILIGMKIVHLLTDEDMNYLVIVPEQFTMQTQRDFVTMHPRKGIFNIDVLSFQRLAFHVLEEVGENGRLVLEETGKNIVLRKLAKEHEKELKILGRNMKKLGYISEVKSLISELIQYQVTPELLEETIRNSAKQDLLVKKLEDVLILYRAFLEYMGKEYMTSDQVLQVLNEVLERSEKLKGAIIVLDGFTALNPVQLQLVQGLCKVAKKVYMTVTVDTREEVYSEPQKTELFYLSKKLIQSVTKAAKEVGVELFVLDDGWFGARNDDTKGLDD